MLAVADELAGLGIELQQAVEGRRLAARRLGEALGGAAGGRRQQHLLALLFEDPDEAPHQRRLAGAGAAGDHQHLAGEAGADGLPLLAGELDRLALLEPVEGAVDVDLQRQRRLDEERPQARRDPGLGSVKRPEVDGLILGGVQRFEHDLLGLGQRREGPVDEGGRRFEQLLGLLQQRLARQVGVAAVARLPQQVERAGLDALRRRGRNAEGGGDLVGRLESRCRRCRSPAGRGSPGPARSRARRRPCRS